MHNMDSITSYSGLIEKTGSVNKAFILLYKKGSEQSDCAIKSLAEASVSLPDEFEICTADVSVVRDIHEKFGITTVPSLMLFEKGDLVNILKGCHDPGFFRSLFRNAIYAAPSQTEGKPPKSVTVYSTPTCSWCNTLKSWLRKNNIPFSEIDVSRDEASARELVNRTGQQGVPQTDINGQLVVGFNEKRLKELLEI